MRYGLRFGLLMSLVLSTISVPARAQDKAVINPIDLGHGIYALMGQGGTMGLCVGEDGAFLIDDQIAPITDEILATIKTLTDKPVKFMINTHWHGDHTGGNENMGAAGAILMAHENVRTRMSAEQFREVFDQKIPASPEGALPMVTFTDEVTFHMNGETIRVFHVENAHTDGDCMIHFQNANVIHMGDILFNGLYPFIDVDTGGTYKGVVKATDLVISMADDQTKIIPGHGEAPASKQDLVTYRNMLTTLIDRFEKAIDEGKSLEEIQAAKLTAEFDETWNWSFITTERMVRILHDDLSR